MRRTRASVRRESEQEKEKDNVPTDTPSTSEDEKINLDVTVRVEKLLDVENKTKNTQGIVPNKNTTKNEVSRSELQNTVIGNIPKEDSFDTTEDEREQDLLQLDPGYLGQTGNVPIGLKGHERNY